MHLPDDHVYASSAVISACVFGLDSAKTTGRLAPFTAHSASITFLLKQLGARPTAPQRTVGRTASIVSTRSAELYSGLPVRAKRLCSSFR